MPKPGRKELRIKRAKKKIAELISRGTPFNPRKVSGSTLQTAAASGKAGASSKAKAEIKRRIQKGSFR